MPLEDSVMTKRQIADADIRDLYLRVRELKGFIARDLYDGGTELELKAVQTRLSYLDKELERLEE